MELYKCIKTTNTYPWAQLSIGMNAFAVHI